MAGVVTQCLVHEGEFVRQGTPLFIVTDERRVAGDSRRTGAALREQLAARRGQLKLERDKTVALTQETALSVRERLSRLHNEADDADREIQLTRAHATSEAANLERYKKLAASHFLSDIGLSEKINAVADLQARLAATERMRASLDADISTAESELKELPLRMAVQVATIDGSSNSLEQESIENDERDQIVVTAASDGTIAAILAHPGESVRSQALATLLPAGARLDAELFVPSRWIGFVAPGQLVRLRYDAYPYQKFGQYDGSVATLSNAQIDPADIPPGVPRATADEALYKITVNLKTQNAMAYGVGRPLLSGMVVEASIMQDTRRLIEWIFEPLVSLKGNVMN